jgi:hypothetical protein
MITVKVFLSNNTKFPKEKKIPQVPALSDPIILGPTSKLKIILPIFSSLHSEVSRKVCHVPIRQKLMEEIYFSAHIFVRLGFNLSN